MSKAFKKENCWDLCICTHTSWYSDKFSWWLRRSENESDNHRINPAEWQVSIPAPKQVWVIEPATSLLLAHLAYSFCSFSCPSMETCRKMFRKQETLVRMWMSECGQLRYELIVQQQSIGAIFTTAWHCMDHVLKAQVLQCIGMHRNASTPVALKKTCQILQSN